jgi:hypothetical protein
MQDPTISECICSKCTFQKLGKSHRILKKAIWLKFNLNTIKPTSFKYTCWWNLTKTYSHVSSTILRGQNFIISKIVSCFTAAMGSPLPYLQATAWNLVQMEPNTLCIFYTWILPLVILEIFSSCLLPYYWVVSVVWVCHSLVRVFRECQVALNNCLLWIKLLWIFICRLLCEHIFSFLLVKL